MSIESYSQAKQLILNHKDRGFFAGPRPEGLIEAAEHKLGLKFTGTYLDFLRSFGAGNFGSDEVYGIIDGDFEDSCVPDAIWFTLNKRKEIDFPQNLLVIYDTGSDELFCLDFNRRSTASEPIVVAFVPGLDHDMQTNEVIANDFGDFLLEMVKSQL